MVTYSTGFILLYGFLSNLLLICFLPLSTTRHRCLYSNCSTCVSPFLPSSLPPFLLPSLLPSLSFPFAHIFPLFILHYPSLCESVLLSLSPSLPPPPPLFTTAHWETLGLSSAGSAKHSHFQGLRYPGIG